MATVNLGSIKFNWQGAYAGGTAYAVDDVVSYNGSSYICKLASTGNLPTNTTYWDQMSSAGTNGTDGTDLGTTLTTQGDIVYRDASGLARLGAGTAGQVLQSGGTGANPSWIDQAGGATEVISHTTFDSTGTATSLITTTDWSTNNYYQISVVGQCDWGNRGDQGANFRFRNSSGDIADSSQYRVGIQSYGNETHADLQLNYDIDLNGTTGVQINGWGQNQSRAKAIFTIDVYKPDVDNRQVCFIQYYNNDNSSPPYHAHYQYFFSTSDTGTKTGFNLYNSGGYNFTNGFVTVVGHKYA